MDANRDRVGRNDPEGLDVAVREQGATTSIALHGEWDLASLASSHRAICTALDEHPDCVVLDLSRLTFIDSTGLHATIDLATRAAAQNTRLAIIPGPEPVRRMFEITRLLDRLPFIDQRPNGTSGASPHIAESGGSPP